jgi:hypothetical protein
VFSSTVNSNNITVLEHTTDTSHKVTRGCMCSERGVRNMQSGVNNNKGFTILETEVHLVGFYSIYE